MPNGEKTENKVWDNLHEIEKNINNLARDGCGHKRWHEATSDEIKSNLSRERNDRERMGEFWLKELRSLEVAIRAEMVTVKEAILTDNKSTMNKMLLGMLLLLALTLVIDKVLK